MKMNEYQKQVERTRNYDNTELANYTLGLVCEAGEVGDIIKKHIYHQHDLDKEKIISELGDVMWYLNNICNVLDISIEEVAKSNIEKLIRRYPNGFSKNDSINRDNKEIILQELYRDGMDKDNEVIEKELHEMADEHFRNIKFI